MGTFPNLSNVNSNIVSRLDELSKSNVRTSELQPWIRLTSGANLVLESIPSGSNFGNLYGTTQKSGMIGSTWTGEIVRPDDDNAYNRGYRPSPTISSLSVENGHRGLSRKTKFTIKCYSLPQADTVAKYFLEPAYTCLVEFGWNESNSAIQKVPLGNDAACNIARMNNFGECQNRRTASGGTYDVFLGIITGGGFKSAEGETYDIDVELTTVGEIPAYLQTHKSGQVLIQMKELESGRKAYAGGENFSISGIEDDADSDDLSSIGKSLFKQMYNRLPNEKQIRQVKSLIYDVFKDSRGRPWYDVSNFINMDDEIREALTEKFQDQSVATEKGTGKVPDGVPLASDQSFIRVELAFEILNQMTVNIKPKDAPECSGGVRSYDFTIDISDTICRGFKHMFSTDQSVLYVPNKNLPDFGLVKVLTSDAEITQFIELTEVSENSFRIDKVVDGAQTTLGGDVVQFPESVELNKELGKFEQFKIESDAYKWGYLKDLYINFDFFIETIKKTNFVTKDVYYELLNGISSAVNSYWFFEIVQGNDKDDWEHLRVVDLSFSGKKRDSQITTRWRMTGTTSPFLDANLSMDIPGVMKNQIVAQRSATKVVTEGDVTTFFNGNEDKVMKILDAIKESDDKKPQQTKEVTDERDADEILQANYETFISKAAVFPLVKGRNDKIDASKGGGFFGRLVNRANVYLSEVLFVGAWSDSALLKQIEFYDLSQTNISTGTDVENNPLMPIEFSFTVHGVAGFKVGDMFYIDDLPKKFRNTPFQIVTVEHQIDQSVWKTNIKAQLRNTTNI